MQIIYQNNNVRLPDFLIVGAAKSGTTSLHHYLRQHPDVYMPDEKEPYFFSFWDEVLSLNSPDDLPEAVTKLDDYTGMFSAATEDQIIGDASPSYLYTWQKTISNIEKLYGDKSKELKIVAIIREPVARAWSQYIHFRKYDKEPLSYEQAFDPATISERLNNNWNVFYDYLGFSRYAEAIQAFSSHFPHFKLFLFDELKDDSGKLMSEICRFLSIQDLPDEKVVEKVHNVSGLPGNTFSKAIWNIMYKQNPVKKMAAKVVPKNLKNKIFAYVSPRILEKEEMPEKAFRILKSNLNPDFEQLESITGKDLSKWKK